MKVIQWMCVTLNSKVNRQGHGIVFNIFDILDLENVRIDTKINFVSCLQPEIWKVMQKGVWPWFSRSCNKDRIFSLSPLDSLTPKTYPWEIFLKNSDGKTKIQGGGWYPPPLGRPKVDFYLGHLRICSAWSKEELSEALMPTLDRLFCLEPEAAPFRIPVDPIALGIPVCWNDQILYRTLQCLVLPNL